MATTQHLQEQSGGLPPLSPNFQATQLLTPRQLERITIDQPHYHGHLAESVTTTKPPTKDAIERRVGKMGDKYFFLQKELPVEQAYARTTLQLSQVRPWDQIVQRPMKSTNMASKEIHMPFPQEHPYTSHISRFAVFPDTSQPGASTLVDAQTQTGSSPNPPIFYQVSQKAGEWGQRVECRYPSAQGSINLKSGAGTLLWDLPRSQRHKRAFTYPAPSLQYSRPPTAAKYLPLPATIKPSDNSLSPISPASQSALGRIHKVLTRTTTYSEQYSTPNTPRELQNTLQTAYTFRSRESHRPWTAESRGKYNRVAGAFPLETSPDSSFGCIYKRPQPLHSLQDDEQSTSIDSELECEEETAQDLPLKVDASTQTEEEYFESISVNVQLPSLVSEAPNQKYFVDPSRTVAQNEHLPQGQGSHLDTARSTLTTPRTARSTQRLMTLFNGFNKTTILKRFHEDFPEKAPDLREFSIHEGKRHVIHGSHAYYYH